MVFETLPRVAFFGADLTISSSSLGRPRSLSEGAGEGTFARRLELDAVLVDRPDAAAAAAGPVLGLLGGMMTQFDNARVDETVTKCINNDSCCWSAVTYFCLFGRTRRVERNQIGTSSALPSADSVTVGRQTRSHPHSRGHAQCLQILLRYPDFTSLHGYMAVVHLCCDPTYSTYVLALRCYLLYKCM